MAFIQIIEFSTSRFEEGQSAVNQYRQQLGDRHTGRRATVCKDRDRENVYLSIVEFDSYEDAMANSKLPETDALAKKLAELSDGPPTFRNLDVVAVE